MKSRREVVKLIERLGFEKITPSRFWVQVNDIYHLIELRGDRRLGGLMVGLAIWHPLFEDSLTEGKPSGLYSPVVAYAAPNGAFDNWTWDDASIDLIQIERVIRGFFSGFLSSKDIVRALEGIYVWPAYVPSVEKMASGGLESYELTKARPAYEVIGRGADNLSIEVSISGQIFKYMTSLGFKCDRKNRLLYMRQRGNIHDCVQIRFDIYRTLASIDVFQWTPDLWRADKRLRGTYHPFNGFEVEFDGRPILFSTANLQVIGDVDIGQGLSVIDSRVSDVTDIFTYINSIRPEHSTVAAQLRAFASRKVNES